MVYLNQYIVFPDSILTAQANGKRIVRDVVYEYALVHSMSRIPYGLVVRIPAFHAGGPGSIPGVGAQF